jgi:hypothetical protein
LNRWLFAIVVIFSYRFFLMKFIESLISRSHPLLCICTLGFTHTALVAVPASTSLAHEMAFNVPADSIAIRDPFILTDHKARLYYLYARTAFETTKADSAAVPVGVQVYLSRDLLNWSEPRVVMTLPDPFWARAKVWAPEVHLFQDRYYLFVTLSANEPLADQGPATVKENWPELVRRGTQIFVSETPTGPFEAFSNKPHTPLEWMTVDGTLWVEDGKPYMVFCHAWQQIEDGTMNVVPLSSDLSNTLGEPQILFRASDAPWGDLTRPGYVTNGPYLHQMQDGTLNLIWSTYGLKGYAVGQAVSKSGSVFGPWVQSDHLLFEDDGGHASLFTDLEGNLNIVLHQPNSPRGAERMRIFRVEERSGHLHRIDRTIKASSIESSVLP